MKESIKKSFLGDAAVVLKVFVMIAIPTALLLFHVSTQYRITEAGYEIARVTTEHRHLLEDNKKLTVEARMQGRNDRLAEMARNQFGLAETRPEQVITVELQTPAPVEGHARLESAHLPVGVAAIH